MIISLVNNTSFIYAKTVPMSLSCLTHSTRLDAAINALILFNDPTLLDALPLPPPACPEIVRAVDLLLADPPPTLLSKMLKRHLNQSSLDHLVEFISHGPPYHKIKPNIWTVIIKVNKAPAEWKSCFRTQVGRYLFLVVDDNQQTINTIWEFKRSSLRSKTWENFTKNIILNDGKLKQGVTRTCLLDDDLHVAKKYETTHGTLSLVTKTQVHLDPSSKMTTNVNWRILMKMANYLLDIFMIIIIKK